MSHSPTTNDTEYPTEFNMFDNAILIRRVDRQERKDQLFVAVIAVMFLLLGSLGTALWHLTTTDDDDDRNSDQTIARLQKRLTDLEECVVLQGGGNPDNLMWGPKGNPNIGMPNYQTPPPQTHWYYEGLCEP